MQLDVITLFPEMFEAVSRCGITRRALEEGRFNLQAWNPRDFTTDNYKTIDDRPYGGGPGMVMMAEPLDAAIEAARSRQKEAGIAATKVIYLSPQGETLTDAMVRELAAEPGLVLVGGVTKAWTKGWCARRSTGKSRSATTSPRAANCRRWW